jgi:mono/diheme cytochrome c family protein
VHWSVFAPLYIQVYNDAAKKTTKFSGQYEKLMYFLIVLGNHSNLPSMSALVGQVGDSRGGCMKKTTILLLGVVLAAPAAPLAGRAKFVKAGKDAGIAEIKNCGSCHTDKNASSDNLNEAGKWLVEQKTARNAAEYDINWLKDYFANKKQSHAHP